MERNAAGCLNTRLKEAIPRLPSEDVHENLTNQAKSYMKQRVSDKGGDHDSIGLIPELIGSRRQLTKQRNKEG